MRMRAVVLFPLVAILVADAPFAAADSRGDELARWLDSRGQEVWGEPPERCDELTFARRVYLDILGREILTIMALNAITDLQFQSGVVDHRPFGGQTRLHTGSLPIVANQVFQDILADPFIDVSILSHGIKMSCKFCDRNCQIWAAIGGCCSGARY